MRGTSRRAWTVLAVAALLALHFALAVASKRNESTTSDELVHVTGGYSYWRYNDYRLQPENGNLPQRWVALPAWLMGAKFPELDQPFWKLSDAWVMGHQFFYETGEDIRPRLMAARAMAALFSVALGALVFAWSRRLFGTPGAFVSLGFFTFCPTLLAHGGLATSDGCIALFMLASIGAYWRHLRRPGTGPLLLSALVFGLACVAKFSAVFLLPMMAACAVVQLLAARGGLGRVVLSAAAHAAAAFVVIWAFYGFRYSAFNPAVPAASQFIESWEVMYARTAPIGGVIHVLANLRALPEAFLYGAAYVVQTSQTRASFLNGEYSLTGWHSFFVWSFLLKTTLPFLLAAAMSAYLVVRSRLRPSTSVLAHGLLPLTPLLALFGVYWAISIESHLNIGVRHLLPTYPVLFILAGALGRYLASPLTWRAVVPAGLLAWHAGESIAVYPHYLAYFNEVAGGPAGGYRHLVDSSLDWGQDLPGLRDWLAGHRQPGEAAYLAYFGTGEPRVYHMGVERLAYLNVFHEDEPYIPLGGGLYCIGATMLQQVYSSVHPPWTREQEDEFQFLKSFEPQFRAYAADPAARAALDRELSPEKWQRSRDRFLHLRFARLCTYLRVRRPDAVIGYSIFVYRLTTEEARQATDGTTADWSGLIERSGVGAP